MLPQTVTPPPTPISRGTYLLSFFLVLLVTLRPVLLRPGFRSGLLVAEGPWEDGPHHPYCWGPSSQVDLFPLSLGLLLSPRGDKKLG